MKADIFLGLEIRQPTVTDAVAVVGFAKMLVRRLRGGDDEILGRDRLCLPHHIALMRAVAMDGDQQRRIFTALGYMKVVIEIYLRF